MNSEISEQSILSKLSDLFLNYGYLPYKMNKFEEYDLYVKNKDFLVSDNVITFTDTNGKLMALKPDITISIIKNSVYTPGIKQRVFYNENVFRIAKSTGQFKELIQSGGECIGDIDETDIADTISLCLKALSLFGVSFSLDVSHLGIVSSVLSEVTSDRELQNELMRCLFEKNTHEIEEIGQKFSLNEEALEKFETLVDLFGKPEDVLKKLSALKLNEEGQKALSALKTVFSLLNLAEFEKNINLDFSVNSNMKYYNGFVLSGHLEGISEIVLLGGQYDKLLSRMGKTGSSIGFALYLDAAESLFKKDLGFDFDVLLLYSKETNKLELSKKLNELRQSNLSVSAQCTVPEHETFKQIIDMR